MADIERQMAGLAARLSRPLTGARATLFVPAEDDESAARAARAFARHLTGGPDLTAWLIDLDLLNAGQHRAFAAEEALGPATRASPSEAVFFHVTGPEDPSQPREPDAAYLAAHKVGRRRLWITRFRRERLRSADRVALLGDGAYWSALRPHTDEIIVEAPALIRSEAALLAARHMDHVVIVASARRRDLSGVEAATSALSDAGGRVAGLVLTDAPRPPPQILARLGF